ncbi:MAG TPA: polysaccharide deacetylase family protein [Pirellulales bacterium]|jgi:hypothetical protein
MNLWRTTKLPRRGFLARGAAAGFGAMASGRILRAADKSTDANEDAEPALIAITLDLEMSRNFPTREETHWDYEKGNLNGDTKRYTVEACRRVKAAGGVVHAFAVGRVCEQENLDWLKQLAADGHSIGNHTYDHVNVCAKTPDATQFRFQRSPWLVAGQTAEQIIAENIRLATLAIKERTGIKVNGFRTPGGFATGLADRPDVQKMIQAQGFDWVSSKYPAHSIGDPGREPDAALYEALQKAQPAAQPFLYESGLCEIPMSPPSDIVAFRTGRWKLPWFLKGIEQGVRWAIENRAVFDFLGHPSCLYAVDPSFQTLDLICDLVGSAGPRAKIVNLETIARRTRHAAEATKKENS